MLPKKISESVAFIVFLTLIICLFSCKTPDNNDSGEQVQAPPGMAVLKIQNNTPYTVNVYINDPPIYSQVAGTLRTVSPDSSAMWELQASAANGNGDTLYFEYMIPIGSATIPYYASNTDNIKIKKLIAGQINTQDVPPLGSATTNSSFVLIRNDSSDTVWVQQGSYTRNPFGSSERDIAPRSSNAVFVLDSNASLSGFTIGALTRRDFPNTTIEKGKVYTFVYDGTGNPKLFVVTPFSPNIAQNSWTIPTRTNIGKYFAVGVLRARANVANDGYIVAGKVNYSLDTLVFPELGAIPYLGMISPSGNMTVEKRISIRNGPNALNMRDFIDNSASNELVFAGQAYYDAPAGIPFILSTDVKGEVNYYYDGFFNDADTDYLYGYKLAPYGANGYAVGCDFWDSTVEGWRVSITKVSKTGFDTVSHREFWYSPVGVDVQTWGTLKYDQTQNMFVVAAHDNVETRYTLNSKLFFINATGDTGVDKFPAISLPRYGIGHFTTIGQDFYIIGTYDSDSKYRGIIEKIDLSTGLRSGTPWFIDSKFTNGAASIEGFVLEDDGSIVVTGWCVKDSNDVIDVTKWLPWLVKYDLSSRTTVWEEVYEDLEGYYVYSLHHNAIGSYLLELYNNVTYQGYLVSTDLMGRITDDRGAIVNELEPIPRNFNYSADAPGKPKIGVTITPSPADVGLSSPQTVTITKGQTSTISVSGTWASYQWYVNGSAVSGTTANYSFTTAGRNAGIYTVTAVVTDSAGDKFSASCRVTVNN